MREAEAQSELRQLIDANVGITRDGLHTFPNLLLAVVLEVDVTEVALGEDGVRTNLPGQAAFVKWHTHNDADSVFSAIGEQLVFRRLIEDVVDDLHGIDEPCFKRLDDICRLVILYRDTDRSEEHT